MSDVATVKTRLALIQGAISGIVAAHAQGPKSLAGLSLPQFVNFLGPWKPNYGEVGNSGFYEETQTYLMRLYVVPILEGYGGEAERRVEPFIPLVRAAFMARPGLGTMGLGIAENGPLAGVVRAWLMPDGGIRPMAYAQTAYLGVEFRLDVTQIMEYSYAEKE